jgi:putative flippase GtrA
MFLKRKNVLTDMIKLFRFALVGILAVFFDFFVFIILIKFINANPNMSKFLSFISGALVAYFFNTVFTFKKQIKIRNFYRYSVVTLFSLTVNLLTFNFFLSFTNFEEVSWLVATTLSATSNFILMGRWVYTND